MYWAKNTAKKLVPVAPCLIGEDDIADTVVFQQIRQNSQGHFCERDEFAHQLSEGDKGVLDAATRYILEQKYDRCLEAAENCAISELLAPFADCLSVDDDDSFIEEIGSSLDSSRIGSEDSYVAASQQPLIKQQGPYDELIMEKTVSIRGYINSRLAPLASSAVLKATESREFCLVFEMMHALHPEKILEYGEHFQMDVRVSEVKMNLRSLTELAVRDQNAPAASIIGMSVLESPFAPAIQIYSDLIHNKQQIESFQHIFSYMKKEGIGNLAERAEYQITQYQKSIADPNKEKPSISKSDFAYYFTHGNSEYDYLLKCVCSLLSRMVCGSIEEYMTCAFAIQEFFQRINDAIYALVKKRKLLPLAVSVDPAVDTPILYKS